MLDASVLYGDDDGLAAKIQAFFDAGADEVVLSPFGVGDDPVASQAECIQVLSDLARSEMTWTTTRAERPTSAHFRKVLATISAGEFDRLAELMTLDLIFELPYGPDFLPNPIEGLEAWNQMQLMTFKLFTSFTLELGAVHECLDPDELVAEYHSNAVVVRNGNTYGNR